jgi:hypothetical protein
MSNRPRPLSVSKPPRKRWAIWLALVASLALAISIPPYLLLTPEDPDDEPFELIRKSGNMHDVLINTNEHTPSMLFKVAEELCGEADVCDIRYWYDEDKIPSPDTHPVRGEDALYARNRPQRIEMLLQSGREFRR